jgi:hypothetical protein
VRVAVALPLLLSLLPGSSGAARLPLLEVPLRVLVARCKGKSVRDAKWVREHLAAAAQILRPHAIRLKPHLESFQPESCVALDRAARHAFARHVPAEGVTVLVVERVRDLDVPTYDLMGVHWRYKGSDAALTGRRYILLTARARPPVLAHELGHYFGLPHDPAGGNLMTPGPSAPIWSDPEAIKPKPMEPLFTAAQARRIRAAVRRLIEE